MSIKIAVKILDKLLLAANITEEIICDAVIAENLELLQYMLEYNLKRIRNKKNKIARVHGDVKIIDDFYDTNYVDHEYIRNLIIKKDNEKINEIWNKYIEY